MKTTIEVAEDLLLRVRQLAREQNRSMKEIFEQALRRFLAEGEQRSSRRKKIKPIVWGSGGLTPEGDRLGWAGILKEASDREEP